MKKIALISHDGKKAEMVALALSHKNTLKKYDLVATGTTGSLLQKAGFDVSLKLSGPLGGDAEIAAMVAHDEIEMVIFLRDPLGLHVHEPDISMLMRLCDVHNIALATNTSSANKLIESLS